MPSGRSERRATSSGSSCCGTGGVRRSRQPGCRKHLEWIRSQHFEHEAQEAVLIDYLKAVEDMGDRVARLTNRIVEMVEQWDRRPLVKALQALRGVSVISAAVIVAELGDLSRFQTAPQFMGYLGLVPSE